MSAADGSKPTAGPWVVEPHDDCDKFIYINGGYVARVYADDIERQEAEENARLIAEAGTVHHETGKTPRQLQDTLSVLEQERSALAEDNATLRLEVERLRAERDALLAAARGVEGRIYEAAKGINDATRWPDEESFDGSAETIQSWITADLDAAIALAEQQQAGGAKA